MEKELKVIGVTKTELIESIKLAMILKDLKFIAYWGEREETNGRTLYFNTMTTEATNIPFPIVMTSDMVANICDEWLKQFDPDNKMCFGDGSLGRGFKVEIGDWGEPYAFSVKFETMYYGK